jgi:hypothetical protein
MWSTFNQIDQLLIDSRHLCGTCSGNNTDCGHFLIISKIRDRIFNAMKWHAASYFGRLDERLRDLGDNIGERCKSFRNIMMATADLVL